MNGFLSLVIMAFCTHDGISCCGCVCCRRRDGIEPFRMGGGGGAELRKLGSKSVR